MSQLYRLVYCYEIWQTNLLLVLVNKLRINVDFLQKNKPDALSISLSAYLFAMHNGQSIGSFLTQVFFRKLLAITEQKSFVTAISLLCLALKANSPGNVFSLCQKVFVNAI